MSPIALAFWRWLLALLLLLPFTLRETLAHRAVIRRKVWKILILGILSVGAYNTLLYAALQSTEAINATLVASIMPLMIMVLSFLILRESFGWMRTFGLIASGCGVALVIARGSPSALAALELHRGDLYMVGGVFCWGLFSVLLRRWPPDMPPRAFLTAQMALGLLAVAVLWGVDLALGGRQPSLGWESLGVIGYTAIFPSILAYFAWNLGVAAVGANIAGFYANLVPLFTAGLASLLLGERIVWFHVVGFVLIVAGIVLASLGQRRPRNSR